MLCYSIVALTGTYQFVQNLPFGLFFIFVLHLVIDFLLGIAQAIIKKSVKNISVA